MWIVCECVCEQKLLKLHQTLPKITSVVINNNIKGYSIATSHSMRVKQDQNFEMNWLIEFNYTEPWVGNETSNDYRQDEMRCQMSNENKTVDSN